MNKKKNADEMQALRSITEETTTQETSNSLGVIDPSNNLPKYTHDDRVDTLQYIEVNKDNMNYKGIYYPKSWVFKCRAAIGAEVAAFSSIDNNDIVSVTEGIDTILKTCLRIIDNDTKIMINYQNLYEFDRLWFLLFIRDLTMSQVEKQIEFKSNCEHCKSINDVAFSYNNITSKPETEFMEKHWDDYENAFVIQTKSFGIIKVQPTTIKRSKIFMDYIKNAQSTHKQIDQGFLKMFWLLINKDNENISNVISILQKKYASISTNITHFSIYTKISEEINLGMEESITYVCNACEKEAHSNIDFPNGLNNLFIITDINSELL